MLEFKQVSLCANPLREASPAALCLSGMQSLLVLKARFYGDSSSWHWYLKLGDPMLGWDPLFLRGNLHT